MIDFNDSFFCVNQNFYCRPFYVTGSYSYSTHRMRESSYKKITSFFNTNAFTECPLFSDVLYTSCLMYDIKPETVRSFAWFTYWSKTLWDKTMNRWAMIWCNHWHRGASIATNEKAAWILKMKIHIKHHSQSELAVCLFVYLCALCIWANTKQCYRLNANAKSKYN